MRKHLFILKQVNDTKRKTDVFEIYGYKNYYLGNVVWSTGWRQYVFEASGGCKWSHDCLSELAAFIKALMDVRKKGKVGYGK